MDFQRLFLYVTAMFLGLMLWQSWNHDYGPKPVQSQVSEAVNPNAPSGSSDAVPTAPAADVPALPSNAGAASVPSGEALAGKRIGVRTDLLEVELNSTGGIISAVRLRNYPVRKDMPEVPFQLMGQWAHKSFIAQSGLISNGGKGVDHQTVFTSSGDMYDLADGEDKLEVVLVAEPAPGLKVEKIYTFRRDSYLIDISHRVTNMGNEPWTGRQYAQLQKTEPTDDETSAFIYTYNGAALYSQAEKYEKFDFGDMASDPVNRVIKGGWAAFIQHYFVGALIPDVEQEHHYYAKRLQSGRYAAGMISPQETAHAGGQPAVYTVQAFLGPKEQDRMAEASEGLDLSVDYGYLYFIADILFIGLNLIHDVIPNWGWAIIFLTVIIKLVFFKLSETSYRSMARMRKLTPKIQSMKERYGDDKQRMQQAMMDLYKKEKVNPLSGCWPMLVQIPVFIALYWVLLESVEMRQAPWLLWIDDLSTKDPYFVLPLIMGASMFIQQKLNPAPPDPVQAKVMMALPFIFTIFFAFFPSGLVLYWVVNNVLSIAQQYVITKRIEAEG